jgi:hypothetical protein
MAIQLDLTVLDDVAPVSCLTLTKQVRARELPFDGACRSKGFRVLGHHRKVVGTADRSRKPRCVLVQGIHHVGDNTPWI